MKAHEWLKQLILKYEDDENIRKVKTLGDRVHLDVMTTSGWETIVISGDECSRIEGDFNS